MKDRRTRQRSNTQTRNKPTDHDLEPSPLRCNLYSVSDPKDQSCCNHDCSASVSVTEWSGTDGSEKCTNRDQSDNQSLSNVVELVNAVASVGCESSEVILHDKETGNLTCVGTKHEATHGGSYPCDSLMGLNW